MNKRYAFIIGVAIDLLKAASGALAIVGTVAYFMGGW